MTIHAASYFPALQVEANARREPCWCSMSAIVCCVRPLARTALACPTARRQHDISAPRIRPAHGDVSAPI
jgi:hypothetical protein